MNTADEYATLRAAEASGKRIQVWHLLDEGPRTSANGHWVTLHEAATFECPAHLYRVCPDDATPSKEPKP